MPHSLYQNIPIMTSSGLYLAEYDVFYPYDVFRTHDFQFSAINPVSPQTNNSEFEHSNVNRCSDSDSFHSGSGSRPSSTHLFENESDNHFGSMDDSTYFLSLPNRSDWTLASSNIRHCTSSPASSNYTDSRSSPMITEISLYEEVEQTHSSEGGRRTPPPPYRPPVKTVIMSENTSLKTIPSKIFKPPPPYTRTVNNNTNSTVNIGHSGFPVDSSISGNFPLTADRSQSAVSTSDNWWMLPMPSDFQSGGFGEQTTVGGETSTEVFVPADPELWNKEHIHHWLTKVENYYGISRIDRTHMPQDGVSLCSLSVDDFHQITGDRKTAEILRNYMDCVKQSVHFSSKCTRQNTGGNEQNATTFFEAVKHIVGKSSKTKSPSSTGGGQIQLWQFLLELLIDPRHSSLVRWEDEDGTFRFLDPEGTAKLWGERKFKETKSKKPMNYDKLSRSLRHYYMKGIINKVSGRKYTYKFYLEGVLKACSPSGISDSLFICPNFDPNSCDDHSPRNFNLNLR